MEKKTQNIWNISYFFFFFHGKDSVSISKTKIFQHLATVPDPPTIFSFCSVISMVWFGTAQGDTRTTHTTRTAQNKIQCSYLRFSWVGSWVRWVNVYCDGSMCVAVTVKFIVYKTHKHLNYLHCSYNYIIIFLENAKTCKGQLSFLCIITSPVKYPSSLLDKENKIKVKITAQHCFCSSSRADTGGQVISSTRHGLFLIWAKCCMLANLPDWVSFFLVLVSPSS